MPWRSSGPRRTGCRRPVHMPDPRVAVAATGNTHPAQRALKAQVVREQFQRIAGLDVTALLREVEELPGGLLGWRTHTAYAVDAAGWLGLRRHRSHDVEPVDACPLGVAGVGDHPALRRRWPGYHKIAATQGSDGTTTLVGFRKSSRPPSRRRRPDVIDVLEGAA